jgi:2-polyprenyl-3-methyl-5-hydroxy-6-metoxy-1,4-benzoquinol methylase
MFVQTHSQESNEDAFTKIYDDGAWGKDPDGQGTSGFGSKKETTSLYRAFLQKFLKTYKIRSVVDVGCGDWEFSKLINWKNIQYTGYDVVQSVIEKNQQVHGTSRIQFIHGDAVVDDLPSADLLICKDVLQHLPDEDVFKVLAKLNRFKYCLITNDVDNHSLTSSNTPISRGGYRTLDLSQPPFNLSGKRMLIYSTGQTTKLVFLKLR